LSKKGQREQALPLLKEALEVLKPTEVDERPTRLYRMVQSAVDGL
jgi:hypothetical protein